MREFVNNRIILSKLRKNQRPLKAESKQEKKNTTEEARDRNFDLLVPTQSHL